MSMSVRVNFEIGHEAAIRSKRTPEGFTHDWEVFVRAPESDLSHFVEKVVFHLHETFQRPKRVIKEPPYIIKESGYAGFNLPIDIYIRGNDEPKKIHYNYDLQLQPQGPPIIKVQKEKVIFPNPSDEFKRKLLKGGGILVNQLSPTDTDKFKESPDDKSQLLGKPKLGGDISKKHKPKEHRSDDLKSSNSFHDLFGTPLSKGSKVSPDPKKNSPTAKLSNSAMLTSSSQKKGDRATKDKSDKNIEKEKIKSKHSPQKERDRDNSKAKDSDRAKDEKRKTHSKERDRSKDKSSKRPSSPRRSPKRTPPRPSSSSGRPEEQKLKHVEPQINEKRNEPGTKDKKSKKDKKSHEKDKDRDKKEHRKEKEKDLANINMSKNILSDKMDLKSITKSEAIETSKDVINKDKDKNKEKEKSAVKASDTPNSLRGDTLDSKPTEIKNNTHDKKEKDGERRHKHKKKDKSKKDESRSDRDKEKKFKSDKPSTSKALKEMILHTNNGDNSNHGDGIKPNMTPNKDKGTNPLNTLMGEMVDRASSDTEDSVLRSPNEKHKYSEIPAEIPSIRLDRPISENSNSLDRVEEKPKEKVKKNKDKSRSEREERKRKRRSKEEGCEDTIAMQNLEPTVKVMKMDYGLESNPIIEEENNVQHPSHSPELMDTSPPENSRSFTQDYMSELKDLQHKIMTLQDNSELQTVVQMIAETGQFEITKKTFDFDLCTLDRNTVQRLQDFFATSCS